VCQNQEWTLKSVEPGLRVWRHNGSGATKVEVVVQAPLEVIARVLEVPALEKEWNPAIEKASLFT